MDIQQKIIEPDIAVIELAGRIILGSEGMAVRHAIDDALDAGKNKLVLGMSNVSYVDSAGLGIIVSAMTRVKETGGVFRLAGVPETIKQLFKVTNVLQLLTLDPDVDTAVAAVS